jgi:hypothetical protein
MAREILAELRSHFADRMFKTVVNFNTKLKEAASFGQPINEYDPASKGQQDFRMLALELIGSEERPQAKSKRLVDSLADQLESIGASASELLKVTRPPIPIEAIRMPEPAVSKEVPALQEPTAELESDPEVEMAAEAADDPIETSTDTVAAVEAASVVAAGTTTAAAAAKQFDAKLSDYYGVSQLRDAVVFVTLYPRAGSVHIAGDFNNWQPANTPMERVGDSGVWQTKMSLPHGLYRYRLVVDGQWQQDPYNERTELNPYGELNSVLEVK